MSTYSIRPYFDFAGMKLTGHIAHTVSKGTMIYMEPAGEAAPAAMCAADRAAYIPAAYIAPCDLSLEAQTKSPVSRARTSLEHGTAL